MVQLELVRHAALQGSAIGTRFHFLTLCLIAVVEQLAACPAISTVMVHTS
jgi:hypothetical protein